MSTAPPLLQVEGLAKHFDTRRGLQRLYRRRDSALVRAVDGVSFEVARGETLGVIGESGCGKTTLGRTVLRLQDPTAGRILFDGEDITRHDRRRMMPLRRRMQIVFQDPYASLNPRRTVEETVGLPLDVHGLCPRGEIRERVADMLRRVGLPEEALRRYPHQFSGGQRQRVAIARALISHPDLVVCDEPVSALDVSVQAQILHLLLGLQRDLGLTYVFVSHNLALVGHVATRVAVMYLGDIVEIGRARDLLAEPCHPYSRALLSAVPQLRSRKRKERIRLVGDLPSPLDPPPGCKFHTRCPQAMPRCAIERPALRPQADGRRVACHLYEA
jgi:oligopeptide/dipeptide ABC transporter ATP-binding protein